MDLKQTIADSLKINKEYGAGVYKSPDGILEVTYLPDEKVGYIDIKNPKNLKFAELTKKAKAYLANLPEGKWEFNPDTAQKGRIYRDRIFKGVGTVKTNPDMPNNALIFDNRTNMANTVKSTLTHKGREISKPSGPAWDKYEYKERLHWKKHGKGSGKFFNHDGLRFRLDRKNERGKPVRFSIKSPDIKKGESKGALTQRGWDLKNTTLDDLAGKHFGQINPEGGPIHHAAAARLIGNMHRQYETNLNPSWTPELGPTQEGKAFLRNLQNRLNIHSGQSLPNLRSYPPDNPNNPGISKVHNTAHDLARDLGIDPKKSFAGYSNNDLWQYAKNTLAPAIETIDNKLGYRSVFTKAGQAGKYLRNKSLQIAGNPYAQSSALSIFNPQTFHAAGLATQKGVTPDIAIQAAKGIGKDLLGQGLAIGLAKAAGTQIAGPVAAALSTPLIAGPSILYGAHQGLNAFTEGRTGGLDTHDVSKLNQQKHDLMIQQGDLTKWDLRRRARRGDTSANYTIDELRKLAPEYLQQKEADKKNRMKLTIN